MGIPQYFKMRIQTNSDRVLFGNISISSKVQVLTQSVLPANLIDDKGIVLIERVYIECYY